MKRVCGNCWNFLSLDGSTMGTCPLIEKCVRRASDRACKFFWPKGDAENRHESGFKRKAEALIEEGL